jgi:hypothetical protein
VTDPRLQRLRQIDSAATKMPWLSRDIGNVMDEGGYDVAATLADSTRRAKADAEAIASARNILPAVIELLGEVMTLHGGGHYCANVVEGEHWTRYFVEAADLCPTLCLALAVLDRIGDGMLSP